MAEEATLRQLISRWRDDPGATYRSWFLWEERLKNFRSIRRGIAEVVKEIEAGTFGNACRVRWREGCIWSRPTIGRIKSVRSWPAPPSGK